VSGNKSFYTYGDYNSFSIFFSYDDCKQYVQNYRTYDMSSVLFIVSLDGVTEKTVDYFSPMREILETYRAQTVINGTKIH